MNWGKNLPFSAALIMVVMAGLCILGHVPLHSPSLCLMVNDVKSPIVKNSIDVISDRCGSKTGESSADTILGVVANGDASIEAAAKNGGITKIMTIDHKSYNVLGVFARFTTIVTGE